MAHLLMGAHRPQDQDQEPDEDDEDEDEEGGGGGGEEDELDLMGLQVGRSAHMPWLEHERQCTAHLHAMP
jgi:hypothetical protein